jgi:hypothetical protein
MHLRFWLRGNWIEVRERGKRNSPKNLGYYVEIGLVIVVAVIDLLFDVVGVNGVVDVRIDFE